VVRAGGGEMKKIVAIAGQEYGAGLMRKAENSFIGGIARQGLTQQSDFVTELVQQIAQIIGDVVIEQKLHSEAGAICRATSRSISPR